MQLFFDYTLSPEYKTHVIAEDESKHILRVLRKQIGDQLNITNGQGYLFDAEIINIKSKRCEIQLIEKTYEKPLPYQLHIGIAPTKSSDRFEFFLEKATELGITEITPILSKNSERKRININRCERILQSAMKQSQRLYLPKLNEMIAFQKFIDEDFSKTKNLIAHCEDEKKSYFKEKLDNNKAFCILIGPEGDFNRHEIEMAIKQNFEPVSLGNKRLRTETAALSVCYALALQNGI